MPTVIRSRKQLEQDELAQNKKIKPKLRKFLIDEQIRRAKENVTAEQERLKQLAMVETHVKDVVKQARKPPRPTGRSSPSGPISAASSAARDAMQRLREE